MPAQRLLAEALSAIYFAPRPFLLLFSASLNPQKYHTEDAHVLRGFSERLFFSMCESLIMKETRTSAPHFSQNVKREE